MLFIDKLEQLLRANWTQFIDRTQLLAHVLSCIRDEKLTVVKTNKLPEKQGVQMSVSRLELQPEGFLLWAEFRVPRDQAVAVGTLELSLSFTGVLRHQDVTGTLLCL